MSRRPNRPRAHAGAADAPTDTAGAYRSASRGSRELRDASSRLPPVEQGADAADPYQSRLYGLRYYRIVAQQQYDARIEEFLLDCHRRYGRGKLVRALELACGPALLSLGLAARGIETVCVDRSAPMIRAAKREARQRGVAIEAICADMIGFRAASPADLVFCIGPSTSYVHSNAAMLEFLAGIRDSLVPGGVCVADFDFVPALLHSQPAAVDPPWLVFEGEGPAHAACARHGEDEIEIRFGVAPTRYDPVSQRFQSHNEIRVRGPRRSRTLRMASAGKLYFPPELEALVSLTQGLELVCVCGTYDADAKLGLASDRFVLIVRRAPEGRAG
jgi:SAM-dependent methyltransferase